MRGGCLRISTARLWRSSNMFLIFFLPAAGLVVGIKMIDRPFFYDFHP